MANEEVKVLREPRLFRGDYTDKQLIDWLNKLVRVIEVLDDLEKTAEARKQSFDSTNKKMDELRIVRETSICNEFPDPTQHL